MYLENTKVYITKLSENEFHFSYDYAAREDEILNLKQFTYKHKTYEVKKVVNAFSIVGYHSFLVYAKKPRKRRHGKL